MLTDASPTRRPAASGRASEGMLSWLVGAEVVGADDGVMSWHNPDHPGYRYPEAAGLLLHLLAQEGGRHRAVQERIVRGLVADTAPTGGLGRAGVEYLFDTA